MGVYCVHLFIQQIQQNDDTVILEFRNKVFLLLQNAATVTMRQKWSKEGVTF